MRRCERIIIQKKTLRQAQGPDFGGFKKLFQQNTSNGKEKKKDYRFCENDKREYASEDSTGHVCLDQKSHLSFYRNLNIIKSYGFEVLSIVAAVSSRSGLGCNLREMSIS
jgi:hypothetical protein